MFFLSNLKKYLLTKQSFTAHLFLWHTASVHLCSCAVFPIILHWSFNLCDLCDVTCSSIGYLKRLPSAQIKGEQIKPKPNQLYITERSQHFERINEGCLPLTSTEIRYIAQKFFLTWIQMNLHMNFQSPAELIHSKVEISVVCKNASHEKSELGSDTGSSTFLWITEFWRAVFHYFSSNAKPWIFVAPCHLQQFVGKTKQNNKLPAILGFLKVHTFVTECIKIFINV